MSTPQCGAVDNLVGLSAGLASFALMRWDNLFDDLEGQLEQELSAEEVDLQAEEERLRLGRLSVRDRIRAMHESGGIRHPIRVVLTNGATIAVLPKTIGRDWVSGDLVDESQRESQCIVPIAAIASLVLSREQVTDSLEASGESAHGLSGRLGLGFVLRDLCRRRRAIDVQLASGVLHGTIDRVGRDHLDLAMHDAGTPRRENAVTQYRLVPFDQVQLVRV
ncbi:MAG: hypothetical protein JWO18_1878 [Microbacteriaceae bacterium]|jgi:hypothetical protein|nr:hypothetical protein [Microbacteriaceae bacterium]